MVDLDLGYSHNVLHIIWLLIHRRYRCVQNSLGSANVTRHLLGSGSLLLAWIATLVGQKGWWSNKTAPAIAWISILTVCIGPMGRSWTSLVPCARQGWRSRCWSSKRNGRDQSNSRFRAKKRRCYLPGALQTWYDQPNPYRCLHSNLVSVDRYECDDVLYHVGHMINNTVILTADTPADTSSRWPVLARQLSPLLQSNTLSTLLWL